MRIALVDEDDRPGCHLVCGGFRLVSADEGNAREFAAHMLRLEREHRLRPLARLYRISTSLQGVGWAPAAELREELRAWLRPRVRLAWAERRLVESVRALPPSGDQAVTANRQHWFHFVEDDLGAALREYEGATTVTQRQAGLHRVYAALQALQAGNRTRPWASSSNRKLT